MPHLRQLNPVGSARASRRAIVHGQFFRLTARFCLNKVPVFVRQRCDFETGDNSFQSEHYWHVCGISFPAANHPVGTASFEAIPGRDRARWGGYGKVPLLGAFDDVPVRAVA
jgi:hypothetical protein